MKPVIPLADRVTALETRQQNNDDSYRLCVDLIEGFEKEIARLEERIVGLEHDTRSIQSVIVEAQSQTK